MVLDIICIAAFSVLFTEIVVPHINYWIQPYKTVKPFSCFICLAWWLGLFYFNFQTDLFHAIIYAATSSIASKLIYIHVNK